MDYKIIRSKYTGKCLMCDNRWKEGDLMVVCNHEYFCGAGCALSKYAYAVQHLPNEQPTTVRTDGGNDGRTTLSPASVTTSNASNAFVVTTPPPVGSPVFRWEVVYQNDTVLLCERSKRVG